MSTIRLVRTFKHERTLGLVERIMQRVPQTLTRNKTALRMHMLPRHRLIRHVNTGIDVFRYRFRLLI